MLIHHKPQAHLPVASLTYAQRGQMSTHLLTRRIFEIMHHKKTNLALAADVTTCKELYSLIHATGPSICMLKTHIDILTDFDSSTSIELMQLARTYNFVIFEDRKFADIGNTTQYQYAGGMYRIADWADVINAHTLPGPGIIEGLRAIGLQKQHGLFLLAQMSSTKNLFTQTYTEQTVALARAYNDFVIGFIAQERICNDPTLLHCTPGVQLQNGDDPLGQCYLTPDYIIREKQSDIIIVGRGVYQANDPCSLARAYQSAGWHAYEKRIVAS